MILHLTNDFSGSTVYKNLVSHLDALGVRQFIYNPIRDKTRVGKNAVKLSNSESRIIYSLVLNKHFDRLFYRAKISKIARDVEKKVDLSKVCFIHAHTWYSDGGVAYILSQKYNIPYIIAIRNTDINVFYKYLIFQRKFASRILERANHIAFISTVYKDIFFNHLFPRNRELWQERSSVIPNGVDKFWLENIRRKKDSLDNGIINIVYAGTFIKRKNTVLLQKAVIKLNEREGIKCRLHIVGGGGIMQEQVLHYCTAYSNIFKYYGKVSDQRQLLKIYRQGDIFAMPSIHETFGLVYIEALLQGLPVLYTQNDGIDGLYKEKIGEKINEPTVEAIVNGLSKLINNYKQYTIDVDLLINNHNWEKIATRYFDIYKR